jgi:endonuclease I
MRVKSLKYLLSFLGVCFLTGYSAAQPAGYYDSASGLSGTPLQQALHSIIDNHTNITYAQLWTAFQSTDKKSDGKVWDMYSDKPSGTPVYTFTFVTDQCGNYSKEGDCYNREHSFPKSWFGGEVEPMYTDLFHLYPTDGKVNGMRDNYPFGVVSNPTWTSSNGSKLGNSSYAGYTSTVFEPIDAYKGDFARTYFYMAVRYYGEDSGWPGSDMVTGSQPKAWALKMLMEWDIADPVSQKEKDRNEAIYAIQGNRNPFIDNPAYVSLIWGTQTEVNETTGCKVEIRLHPNPANDLVTIDLPDTFADLYNVSISDITGRIVLSKSVRGKPVIFNLSGIGTGYYFLSVSDGKLNLTARLIVSR